MCQFNHSNASKYGFIVFKDSQAVLQERASAQKNPWASIYRPARDSESPADDACPPKRAESSPTEGNAQNHFFSKKFAGTIAS
jgi:hypothetical protein